METTETTVVIFRMDRRASSLPSSRNFRPTITAFFVPVFNMSVNTAPPITTAALPKADRQPRQNTPIWKPNSGSGDMSWRSGNGPRMPCTSGGGSWRPSPDV